MWKQFIISLGLVLAVLHSNSAWSAGKAYITSTPAGGAIFVDGSATGQVTPDTIQGLSAGTHAVTVAGDCMMGRASVDVVNGATARLTVPMMAAGGTLSVQAIPSQVQVDIDGTPVLGAAGAPIGVACGQHTVAASLKGYVSAVLTVDVQMGKNVVVPIQLDKLGIGTISVQVVPKKGEISLDGAVLSKGSWGPESITAGAHVIRADLDGYAHQEEQFVISDGETRDFSFSLVEDDGSAVAASASSAGPSKVRQSSPKSGVRWGGTSLAVVGVGMGSYATIEYLRTATAYREYQTRRDEVMAGDKNPKYANEYYDEEVAPHKTRLYSSAILGGVTLASGIAIMVAF